MMNKENCCNEKDINECCPNGINAEDMESNCCESNSTVTIDGIEVDITDPDKNIVEIAKEVNVSIPAPCYHAKKRYGCCKVCLIELDGEQAYACNTKPVDGMNIIVKRDDLNAIRKERLLAYKENKDNGTPGKCGCS